MSNARAALAVALALAASPSIGRPQAPDLTPRPEPTLRHARADVYVTAAGYGLFVGLELAKDRLAPETCRWCGTNGFDDAARNALLWSDVGRARTASDLLAFGAIPAGAISYTLLAGKAGPGIEEGAWDLLYVAEAGAFAASVTSVAKLIAGRQRPYAVHGNTVEPGRGPDPDDNLSFWSGHTSFSFAIATATGTIASMRGRDEAPWVWGVGLAAATTVGWLRVAGDKHHLTDVLTGAAVGTAFGVGVPLLLHGKQEPGGQGVTFVPLPLGFAGTF